MKCNSKKITFRPRFLYLSCNERGSCEGINLHPGNFICEMMIVQKFYCNNIFVYYQIEHSGIKIMDVIIFMFYYQLLYFMDGIKIFSIP